MKYVILLICVLLLILIAKPKWYLKNDQYPLNSEHATLLTQLGDSALQTADIPVATIMLYNDQIIGQGYNTVRRNHKVSEHAEINAISAAVAQLGNDSFKNLNRKHLTLISTWEPCAMCQAVINNYAIENMVVVQPKSTTLLLNEWWKQYNNGIKYEWNKRKANDDSLQMKLFMKHPGFEKSKAAL